jgi:hypothetical protein
MMMTIDWKVMKPHVPLAPGSSEYVQRDKAASEEIAQWILADRSPLLIGGPAGVGKSTELARAATLLQKHRVACLVQLDRYENMRHLTSDQMLLRIVERVGYLATHVLKLTLSESLTTSLGNVERALRKEPLALQTSPAALARVTLLEVARLSAQRRVVLLIDGLEKVPPGELSRDLFDSLASLPEQVDLVVIIPWHAAFGPHSEVVIRAGERFVPVRALDVSRGFESPDREFFRKLLLQRLHWPDTALEIDAAEGDEVRAEIAAKRNLVNDAIGLSGGLPRVFLQLLADAGSYAKLRRSASWPIAEDLQDAWSDQVDSFARLFLPGDTGAIKSAVGTRGMELELDRKIRLMAHGILLERVRDGQTVLDAHPATGLEMRPPSA